MQAFSTSEKEAQRKTLRERGICVVIPTYNNGKTIGEVVRATLCECDDVIVVDDGCTDDTSEVLSRIDSITIIRHSRNRGKGSALKSGFRKAQEMGFAYAITLDGDGQHYPRDIANLLKTNQEHPGAIIIGSRKMDGVDRSGGSKFANKFANFWFNVQTCRHVSDTQSGYRLYPLRKLHLLRLVSARYEAELSLMVFASWHGTEIYETPIDVYYPPREERVSHFRPAADFTRISILNTLLCVMAVGYGLPLYIMRMMCKVLRTAYTLTVFAASLTAIFTPAIWIYGHIGKMSEDKKRNIHKLIRHVARFVMVHHGLPGVTFRQKISPNVDLSKPSIIICNHQSSLDMLCKLTLPPNMIFITKDWVRRNPFFGFIVRNAGYPSASDGIEGLTSEISEFLSKGYNVVIYPEGTRSKDCKIARYHQGAFVIAQQVGATITPAVIYGTGKVMDGRNLWLNKGIIEMEIGTPISRQELESMGTPKKQASELRQRCKAAYERLANKIEQEA